MYEYIDNFLVHVPQKIRTSDILNLRRIKNKNIEYIIISNNKMIYKENNVTVTSIYFNKCM